MASEPAEPETIWITDQIADLRNVKRIDQHQKDIVYGYIKHHEAKFLSNESYYSFDQLIQDLCLLYLHLFTERWDINKEREFEYIYEQHGDWYHIFGEEVIKRGVTNQYEWKIETKGRYDGRIGIIDESNSELGEGIASIKNGYSMFSHPNVVCAGCYNFSFCCGNVYVTMDMGDLFCFFSSNDILTIQINYDNNTITFHSQKKGTKHEEKLKSTTNCIRLIGEFSTSDYTPFGSQPLKTKHEARMIILSNQI